MAPPRNAHGGAVGSAPRSRHRLRNSPSDANWMAVYGTQRKSAGTVPAQSPRAPSSFKIVVAHCTMPRYLPPDIPLTGSTWTCIRILTTSSGATTTRETPPANAPAMAWVNAPMVCLPCFSEEPPILACAARRWIPSPDASPAAVPSTASRRIRALLDDAPRPDDCAPANAGLGFDAPNAPHAMRQCGERVRERSTPTKAPPIDPAHYSRALISGARKYLTAQLFQSYDSAMM